MVSGCYDLLHSGHVAFFADAAQHGNLYVSVGNDANIMELKHHEPMFPEDERVYMVRAIRHVTWAAVCKGMGYQDWEADLDIVKPDIFFVNEDGDRPAKRDLCAAKGIKYVVAKRDPAAGLQARSSTSIKAALDAAKAPTPAPAPDEDDNEMKVGQANGYGTVAVDLAAEAEKAKATMKALRAAQMNKPPPVAMKKNPITGEMEKFESPALKDDLSDEDVDGDIDVGDMGCGADDY